VRNKPKIVVDKAVCNQSSRAGAKPRLIVLHSTESHNIPDSASDLAAVTNWFDNPSAQASSHVITDSDGHSARCVADAEKAWHVAGFNPWSLGIEQIGFASQGKWERAELLETARWIAHWSLKWDIPIQRGKVAGSAIVTPGVVTHSQLGAYGGGHADPGSSYPVDDVLVRAHKFKRFLKENT
jgi:N-acetyl-anhydromuramyl-L-alanine amidase AmpD